MKSVAFTPMFCALLVFSFPIVAFATGGAQVGVRAAKPDLLLARGVSPDEDDSPNSGGGDPLPLVDRGGPVLPVAKLQAIFWGQSWSNASFTQDKISGLDQFLSGLGGSSFQQIASEYSRRSWVSSQYVGHIFDGSPAPSDSVFTSDSAVGEICKLSGNNPDPTTMYLVYTDQPALAVVYCAWHTYGYCPNGALVQVGYFPALTSDSCSPNDNSGLHSEQLASLANVTGHEVMETMTDPLVNAWYSGNGNEIGDACAWTFSPNNNGLIQMANGTSWKIQLMWSNRAYESGMGYPSNYGPYYGAHGCVQSNTPSCGSLQPGQSLAQGQSISSCDGRYLLILQGDGNLVEYGPNGAVWNTEGAAHAVGNLAVMQGDGNFVLYNNGQATWNSGTYGRPNSVLNLQTDGNLVVYQIGYGGDIPTWSVYTGSTSLQIYGMYNNSTKDWLPSESSSEGVSGGYRLAATLYHNYSAGFSPTMIRVGRCWVSGGDGTGMDHYATTDVSGNCEGAKGAHYDGPILGYLDSIQESYSQVPVSRCYGAFSMWDSVISRTITVGRHIVVAGTTCPSGFNFEGVLGWGEP